MKKSIYISKFASPCNFHCICFSKEMTSACAHNPASHLRLCPDRDILPKNVVPILYNLTIKPDMNNFTFEGKVSIDLDIKENSNLISLNANELAIKEITINYKDEISYVQSYEFHQKEEVLDVKLEKELPAGSKATLIIEFIGFINDKMAGFYRSSYVDSATGSKRYMAVTQFEATDARKAFPCWDEPAVKSKFVITLIVPKDLVGLSNMDEKSRKESEDGKSLIIEFNETPIMSTYLVAWVVGDLDYIEERNKDGVLVRVYATRGHAHQGEFALKVASRTLAIFSDYFDEPYPLPKMDMVAVPDFGAGAMENWGLVTYRTAYLLFDEKDSSLKTKKNVAYVVGHELAHQWFGNLVTMEWWSDLWLNEGFATWVGWLAADQLFPRWDIWTEFVLDDCQAGLSLDGLRSSHPIEVPVKNPSEITQIFDSISYSKGASLIRMLVNFLGEKVFQEGMRFYLKNHKYGNAKTSDLWESLTWASGQPVASIMNSWTKIIGYPVLTVDIESQDPSERNVSVKVTQNRFLNGGNVLPEEDETIWSVPIGLGIAGGVSFQDKLLTSRSEIFTVPYYAELIKLNFGQAGFFRVHYPSEWLERLGKAISEGFFPPSDRVGLISDSFALSIAGKISLSEVLGFLGYFKNETYYFIWAEITSRLSEVLSIWWEEDESIQSKLRSFINSLYEDEACALGFEQCEGENDSISLLRPLILGMAGKCGNKDVLAEARARFDRFIAGDSSAIHPNLRGLVYSLVIRNGGRAEFDQVLELYQKYTVPDQKLAALGALGSSKDSSVIRAALELSKRDDIVRPQDCMYVFRTVGANSSGRRMCWEFVQENWKFFYDRYYRGSISLLSRVVSFSTQEFSKISDAEAVEQFFSDKDVTSIDRTVQQSLEKIRSNSAWLSGNKDSVAQWLANLKIQ